jgi:outer membrane cobalamin receptor
MPSRLGAGILCWPLSCFALQEAVRDTIELPQIQSKSDPNAVRLRAAQSEVVLLPKDWEGRSVSLADLIAEQAGIETRRYGGMGSFQTVTVRGGGSDRLLVYLDDVPLNSAGGGPVDLGKLNLDLFERIEIRKGMVPAEEGGNAMGGSLHLYTRGHQNNQAHLSLSAGSHGAQQHSLAGGYSVGPDLHRVSIFANVGYSRADNDFEYLNRNSTPYNPDDDFWTTRENSEFRSLEAHVQARFALGSGQSLRFKTAYSGNSGGLPGSEGEVTHTAGFSNTLRQYLVGWEYAPNSEGQRLAIQASLDDETPEFHWTKADPIGLTSGHDTTEISTRSIRSQGQVYWDVAWKSGTREWRLSSLVSGGQENLEPSGTISDNPSWNNRRRNVLGAADISFQPDTSWTITVGGQGQIVSDYTEGGIAYYGAAVPPTDKTESYPAGRLGVLWRPINPASFFANAGRFYHLPSLTDRFGGRWGMIANPDLLPERGLNTEAGARWRWQSGFMESCLFWNRTDDALFYLRSANLIKPSNLDATLAEGLELTLEQGLPFGVQESFVATAQHTENISDTYYHGLILPDQPVWRHVLKTRIPLPFHFSAEHMWDFRTSLYRDPGNLERIPPQHLHHALLRWNWKRHISVSASVENITDTYYENAYDAYPYPGRQFFVAVNGNL